MNLADFIIVGQGLAGTLMADELLNRGKKIIVIDHLADITASKIASGMMNPITGRRFVKSWMYQKLIPVAKSKYQDLEEKLNTPLIQARDIIRKVPDQGAMNDWLAKVGQSEYQAYIVKNYVGFRHPAFYPLELSIRSSESYQLDIPGLVKSYSKYLAHRGLLVHERFDHSKVDISTGQIAYGHLSAKAILFCEGHRLKENTLFDFSLLHPSIGERFEIQIPNLALPYIIKRKFFLAPMIESRFWFGASTHWDFDSLLPSQRSKDELNQALSKMLRIPFEILRHDAAIRPTVRDRRPILGSHPRFKNVFVFNGLGTKGASLGPYWSKMMADYLCNKGEIPGMVSINRFLP